MARPPARRRGRLIRIIALVVGGVVVLVVAGVAVLVATFDPNRYKPQIIAAVQSATGRTLTIGGRIGLSLSLQPTLEVSDVGFSNPSGFSRPQMATLQKLELQLALIPLLSRRVQIEQLVLQQPDILLETNAQGQSNWNLSPASAAAVMSPTPPPQSSSPASPPASSPASSQSSPPASPAGAAAAAPPSIALSSLKIEGGTLTIRDDATGRTTTVGLTHLAATAASPDAPMNLTVDATYNGAPFGLTADTGPLSALLGAVGSPWPIKLAITAASAKLGVDGTIAEPSAGRGLALAVTANIPDLAALTPFAGTPLPPLKNLSAQFKLADAVGGNTIAVSDLTLTLPKGDLAGSASVQPGARSVVKANLSVKQIDLDALSRAMSEARAMSPGAPGGSAKPARPAAPSGHIIPDTKLPLDALRQADADVQLAVGRPGIQGGQAPPRAAGRQADGRSRHGECRRRTSGL